MEFEKQLISHVLELFKFDKTGQNSKSKNTFGFILPPLPLP
jgi:hypothetical protein